MRGTAEALAEDTGSVEGVKICQLVKCCFVAGGGIKEHEVVVLSLRVARERLVGEIRASIAVLARVYGRV